MEFSTKVGGWGQQWTDFPLIFFFFEKKMSLNPLKLAKIILKQTFFLLQFLVGGPSSAMIVVIWEAQTSNLSGRAIWQLSDYLNNRIPFLRIYFSGGVGGVILMSLLFYESRAFWTYLFLFFGFFCWGKKIFSWMGV